MFSYYTLVNVYVDLLHQYLPLLVYEVPAIRVNTTKSTYTFTSVISQILLYPSTGDLSTSRKKYCLSYFYRNLYKINLDDVSDVTTFNLGLNNMAFVAVFEGGGM